MNENPNKAKIILSYIISLLGFIFLYTDKDAPETDREHYAQAATIFIVEAAISIITSIINAIGIPVVGLILGLIPTALLILAIIAAVKSANGELFKIPVVYDFSKKIFGKKAN